MLAMAGGRNDNDVKRSFQVYDLGEITLREIWVTCLFVGP